MMRPPISKLPLAPLGERGARPVIFQTSRSKQELADVLAIPGVGWYPGCVLCSWDIAWRVAELMGFQLPPEPTEAGVAAPGLDEYNRLRFAEVLRRYQKTAVLFLLRRAWAILALPMRTGKTLVAIAADVALGSEHTLIVAPGGIRWTWVDELAKWTGRAPLILEGRGGREAREYCLSCKGTGLVARDEWCPDCRQLNGQSYGYRIIEVRTVSRPVHPEIELPEPRARRPFKSARPSMRLNLRKDPPMGPRYPRRDELAAQRREYERNHPPLYRCSIHAEVTSANPKDLCVRCREYLMLKLQQARYLVSSYETMIGQDWYDETGARLGQRLDLPGWAPLFARLRFDVAILDEIRMVRGRPEKKRRKKARRARLSYGLQHARRVFGLDGTPVGGHTRDLWSPLDIISDGLFGRPHYDFDERYCDGHTDERGGWVADGRSPLAETELKRRISYFILKMERSVILPELPPKQFSTITIETDEALPKTGRFGGDEAVLGRGIASSLGPKIPVAVDNMIAEALEGNCVFFLTYHPESCHRVMAAVEAELSKPQYRQAREKTNMKTWLATGDGGRGRTEMCKDFVRHAEIGGGGILGSTILRMKGGYSLKGASSVHVIELYWKPDDIMQAIDRPNEVGITNGLSVILYKVKGSFDEHVLNALGPQFDTQVALIGDEDAQATRDGLLGKPESVEEIERRLTAHLYSINDEDS